MAAGKAVLDDVSYVAEGLTGTACATALRKARSLAESAPPGRAFAAIATLAEISMRAADALESTAEAAIAGDQDIASLELARGVVLMGRLSAANPGDPEVPAEPAYLRRRRVHFDL
jgi:hypothetical protein